MVWESECPRLGQEDWHAMAHRRWHTPEQIIRKLRETERLQAQNSRIPEVARQLETSEQTFERWRNQSAA